MEKSCFKLISKSNPDLTWKKFLRCLKTTSKTTDVSIKEVLEILYEEYNKTTYNKKYNNMSLQNWIDYWTDKQEDDLLDNLIDILSTNRKNHKVITQKQFQI